jgi:hypothetical protein
MPSAQERFAIQLQVTDNIADFMRGKPGIHGDSEVMKPEFGFFIAAADVNVRRLVAFI